MGVWPSGAGKIVNCPYRKQGDKHPANFSKAERAQITAHRLERAIARWRAQDENKHRFTGARQNVIILTTSR